MKVLYLTNIEVPYRVRFFNQLASHCDLTVVYERENSLNRNEKWAHGVTKKYHVIFLKGFTMGRESGFSFQITNIVRQEWDVIIVGCYNTKVQMMTILMMRLLNIPYIINLDGEPFIGTGIKARVKRFFLKGARAYLVAGLCSGASLQQAFRHEINICPYYFSSLEIKEIEENHKQLGGRTNTVLVVGQYFDYKGMDVAYQAACQDLTIKYKFIGMGKRTELFCQHMGSIPDNIEIVPFLQKENLEDEYKHCSMMVLPSRQECWGLVINEAASFGTPIVSTWGSGAAVEFLSEDYPQYLAKPGDADSLYDCIKLCLESDNTNYSQFLKEKSGQYNIERSVGAHIALINSYGGAIKTV